MMLSGTVRTGAPGAGHQFQLRDLRLSLKCMCLLPLTSRGQPRAIEMVSVFGSPLDYVDQQLKRGILMCGAGILIMWSLAFGGSKSSWSVQ